MTRRQYSGGAITASLLVGISNVETTISCTALTNWPDGSIGPFFIVIGRGTASEEKILCVSRTGNVLVVSTAGSGGRGADGTSATSHSTGAVVEHIFTGTDADEANYHVNASTSTTTISVHGLTNGAAVVGTKGLQTLEDKVLVSPSMVGNPTAPTPATTDADTSIATTLFVSNKINQVIQRGTLAVTVASGTSFGNSSITFSPTFLSAPTVMVVTRGGNGATTGAAFNAYVTTVAAGACGVGVRQCDGGVVGPTSLSINVDWIAIGPA